jgi:Transposase DDE domain group 1
MALARMLMIAAEDCDDVNALRIDPALKIAVGRAPDSGADLISQPTLSRLENLADRRALARIGLGQIDLYCRSFKTPPRQISVRFSRRSAGLNETSSAGVLLGASRFGTEPLAQQCSFVSPSHFSL